MSQLNIFSTIVLSLFVIISIDCIDSSRQLSRNDRQELAKFKLTVKLLNAVLNDNDNNPGAGADGGRVGGGGRASNRNLPAVSSGIEADNEKGVVYSDSNRKRINKQEYLRLRQEWDRQQQQPNGGVGVNNNSGTTVPVGPPRKQWGGYSAHQNGGGVYQHIDKNGKTYSTYGIPAPPVFTYYDNNRNKVSREHWRQFNSDWPNDEYDDGFTYRDSNDNTIKKHEYNRLKYEWNQQQHRQQRQQRQPNGSGVGVNNNGTTVPVGPPKRSWGSIGVVRLGPVAEFIEDKDGNVRRIPNNKWGEPTYHYYDPKHNEVTKEQWQQFNTDLAENKFKKV